MKSTLDVCQRLDFNAQVYGEYSQTLKKFSQAIWTFITTEVEAQTHLFSPLCQILDEFSDCDASICKVIRRSIEDLRDIAERNIVIQRKVSEHELLIKQYENAKLKVEEARKNFKLYESRSDYYLKKESLENAIKELENEQREATRKARDGTLSLIEDKRKFSNFTTRRIKSCFERLGNAFKTNSEQSIILLNRFIEGLKAIKNGNQLPNFVLYGQDTVFNELNPPIKDSVISENENEYILCEKVNDQNSTNSIQNDNKAAINSNEIINPTNDNENETQNKPFQIQNELYSNDIQKEAIQESNDIKAKQEEAISNENNSGIEQNNFVFESDSTSQIKKDFIENSNDISSNSNPEKTDLNENVPPPPTSNE